MNRLFVLLSFSKHLIKSKSKFKIHSPFVYDLITKGFYEDIPSSVRNKILERKKFLYSNNSVLETVGFRTKINGLKEEKSKSAVSYKTSFKRIKNIARADLLKPRYLNLIYNLVKYLQPQTIVELGSSFGITTSMMAFAKPDAEIYSLEGCKIMTSFAHETFRDFKLKNIKLCKGELDIVLSEIIKDVKTVDMLFFESNFNEQDIVKYFNFFLPLKNNNTIFIFNNIHLKLVHNAWKYIKNHPETVLALDLFKIGIVFFRKELSRQYIVYRF